MNIGNLEIHQWVIPKLPETIANYIEYDETIPLQPLQLQVAIKDFEATQADTGNLTALVRYFTPYLYLDGYPALLYFGLGKGMAVRAVIGIPTLKQWGVSIKMYNNQLRCINIKNGFPLIYEHVQNGLLSNSHFTPTNFCRTTTTAC